MISAHTTDMMEQFAAAAIFLVLFALIITEIIERHKASLLCGGITLVLLMGLMMRSPEAIRETLNLGAIFQKEFWYDVSGAQESSSGINWATIIFIFGMMLLVEFMAQTGFFKWLCVSVASISGFRPKKVFLSLAVLSALLAMFIDSITVILFLAAVTAEMASLMKFDPVPFILTEIFCANLGGAATMCGDPPNIIIGTSLGYSFGDFLKNTGPIAFISLILTLAFFYICFRKKLESTESAVKRVDPNIFIEDKNKFIQAVILFTCIVVMLISHGTIGFTVAFVGALAGASAILLSGKNMAHTLMAVDYKTLIFFTGLFVTVAGLEQTGVLETAAEAISRTTGGNVAYAIFIIIWVSGIASAFVDNIPFAAVMIPVIKSLSQIHGFPLDSLAWALAMGTDVGGSATPVGASANVVGLAAAERRGHHIGWKKYCVYMMPAAIISMGLATFILINQ